MTVKQIELAKHMIGLDYKCPYRRNNKLFYRPYRNYFSTCTTCNDYPDLADMESKGLAKSHSYDGAVYFFLTEKGLSTLGQILGVKIYDEERT